MAPVTLQVTGKIGKATLKIRVPVGADLKKSVSS